MHVSVGAMSIGGSESDGDYGRGGGSYEDRGGNGGGGEEEVVTMLLCLAVVAVRIVRSGER